MKQITISISPRIAREYAGRHPRPDHLPLERLRAGKCIVSLEEAREILADANLHSGWSIGARGAYRALARQVFQKLDAFPPLDD